MVKGFHHPTWVEASPPPLRSSTAQIPASPPISRGLPSKRLWGQRPPVHPSLSTAMQLSSHLRQVQPFRLITR